MGDFHTQPDNREVRRTNGEFYAMDGIVHRAPVHTKTETGTNINVGFPVCEPSDYVDAEQLAGCLNEHEALKSRVEELTKALEEISLGNQALARGIACEALRGVAVSLE